MPNTPSQGRHARIRELARYGAVGVGLVVIEYALYIPIVHLWPQAVLPAHLLARVVAGAAGFVGHSRFSFGLADLRPRDGVRYALIVIVNMALAALLLMALLPLFGPLLAKLVSDGAVIAAGYIAGRRLVFARPARREAIP